MSDYDYDTIFTILLFCSTIFLDSSIVCDASGIILITTTRLCTHNRTTHNQPTQPHSNEYSISLSRVLSTLYSVHSKTTPVYSNGSLR